MDSGFNPDRFTDPELRRERTLSDNKEYIYKLSWTQEEWQEWLHDTTWLDEGTKRPKSPKESHAEFIRDVISFANAARRYGEPGYILFGIEDKQEDLVGIDGQSTNPNMSLDTHKQKQINVENEKSFNRILRQYVHPKPEIEYRRDYIDGKLFGYLEIKPQYTDQPYEVKERFDTGADILSVGDCWIREGESKYPIKSYGKRYLYNWIQIPPVGLENWRDYFVALGKIPDRLTEQISGYQDLFCNNGNELANEVRTFLEAPDKQILIISGHAGCGKSVFLKNLVYQLAGNVLAEVENGKFIDFTNPVPIFLDLNNFVASPATPLDRELLQTMVGNHSLFHKYPQEPERLFEGKGQSWIVLLDAFDEVNIDSPSILWGMMMIIKIMIHLLH